MKKTIFVLALIVLLSACTPKASFKVTDFDSCVAAGNPVMESYPRQCRANDQTFTEIISDNLNNTNQVACTMEAKLCPDGSAVGRSGPNCEFSLCPGESQPSASTLSEAEARVIAEKTCIKGGESLAPGYYNANTQTWWFDANLNATKAGCNPACVVSEATKTAEINWRCTGLVDPKGNVSGQVLLGPTCPVIQNPPDPACADKPYQTTIQVIKIGSPSSAPFATATSNAQGDYEVNLPPGEYALQPVGGSIMPRCETKEITVKANIAQTVNLSCDTGIR